VTKSSLHCLFFKNETSKNRAERTAYFYVLNSTLPDLPTLMPFCARDGIEPRTVAEIALIVKTVDHQTAVTYDLSVCSQGWKKPGFF
jgi:hypothetical protein